MMILLFLALPVLASDDVLRQVEYDAFKTIYNVEGVDALKDIESRPDLFWCKRRFERQVEYDAFKTIYNVESVDALKDIESRPDLFWRKRRSELTKPGATMLHDVFCDQYVHEAQAFIESFARESAENTWWYRHDVKCIEKIVCSCVPKGHAAKLTVLALCYACACDYLCGKKGVLLSKISMKDPEDFGKSVKGFMREFGSELTHEFTQKIRWVHGGNFSVVDGLVMHGEGFYLCSALEPKNREHFRAHKSLFGTVFCGWAGILWHDCLAHSLSKHVRAKILECYGISETKHFGLYCNAENIISGDLIRQSRQHLGHFYNSHELPSQTAAFNPLHLQTVLFPFARELTDDSLVDVTSYLYSNDDWNKECFSFKGIDRSGAHQILMSWRNEYCSQGWEIFPEEYLQKNGRVFSPSKNMVEVSLLQWRKVMSFHKPLRLSWRQ